MPRGRPYRRRRGEVAQAVLEIALVLPIMLVLVFNFLALMVEVQTVAHVETAASLAAESSIAAPVNDVQDSCVYSYYSFFQTLYGETISVGPTGCPSTGGSYTVSRSAPANSPITDTALTCDTADSQTPQLNYYDGGGYTLIVPGSSPPKTFLESRPTGPPVHCKTTITLDFSRTPLPFAVVQQSTFTIDAQATPTKVRQHQ